MIIISLMILIIAIALTPYTALGVPYGQTSIAGNGTDSAKSLAVATAAGGISPILITRLTSIVFLFSGALAYNALHIQSIGSGLSIYSGLFQVTVLSQSFDVILFILASLILIPWPNNVVLSSLSGKTESTVNTTGPLVSEYSLIILFTTLGSSLLLSSGNLLSMYLAIELQSFGVYILATIYRNSESSTNAGLKYFLLGGLSSCLILLGSVLIYSYTGLISFEDIYSLLISSVASPHLVFFESSMSLGSASDDIITVVQLGLVLIAVGFLFKIAAAPFHNWAPDVYSDVPTIVTTWLSIMPKIAIIILSFEILSTINLNALMAYNVNIYSLPIILILISSFLSLIIGTVVGLAQIKIKRLLAYSTISHVGFLLLALAINTEDSLESLIFYLIQYSFTNLNTFFILLAFGYIVTKNTGYKGSNNDINLISELKGQFWSNPLLSLSLALCLLSMAGIPPLMGFFAKAEVLYSATKNGYYFISIIAILVSVISAYYYLQIIRVMHFESPNSDIYEHQNSVIIDGPNNTNLGDNINLSINNTHSFIISTLTLGLLLFMLKPSILLNSIHLMALNIFYS